MWPLCRIAPSLAGESQWNETLLHRFCEQGGECPGGVFPNGGLIMDWSGNLYETTNGGGVNDAGVAFELDQCRRGVPSNETAAMLDHARAYGS
jgi:hypothetical protein